MTRKDALMEGDIKENKERKKKKTGGERELLAPEVGGRKGNEHNHVWVPGNRQTRKHRKNVFIDSG